MSENQSNLWTGNGPLDRLRSKAAASPTGCILVSIEDLNKILPRITHTGHDCEVCGGSMVVKYDDGRIYDDTECWCVSCGFESRTVVDEAGETGIQMRENDLLENN